MEKTELTAREKNEGRVRLLRLLQLLETDSDAEHPISTPDCIRLLKERWDIDAFRITIGRDMEALAMAGYDVRTISKLPKLLEDAAVKKPKGWSIADFSEKAFQLFDGERTTVELLCHEDAMNSVIDHFGEQAKTRPVDDTHFLLTAEVSLSPTFFAWVFQFDGKVKIQWPEEVEKQYEEIKAKT